VRAIFNLRFIPAGAGNTLIPHVDAHAVAVYPRWRGEHRGCTIFDGGQRGLSPLARGTLSNIFIKTLLARFIPAGAGNTVSGRALLRARTVYPRWRGEHTIMRLANSMGGGLSPLARGTPKKASNHGGDHRFIPLARGTQSRTRRRDYRKRFIPAGAGNTLSQQF